MLTPTLPTTRSRSPSLSTSPTASARDCDVSGVSTFAGRPKPFRVVWSKKKLPLMNGSPLPHVVPDVKQSLKPFTVTRMNSPAGCEHANAEKLTATAVVLTSTVNPAVVKGSPSSPRTMPGTATLGSVVPTSFAATPCPSTTSVPETPETLTKARPPSGPSWSESPLTAIATTPEASFCTVNVPESRWPATVSVVFVALKRTPCATVTTPPPNVTFLLVAVVLIWTCSCDENSTPGTSTATSALKIP